MKEVINKFAEELSLIRSDRATPSMVENLPVEVYGSKLTIKELTTIASPETRQLLIEPWDKTIIGKIKKTLERFNPRDDGDRIRITLPSLTDERRSELLREVNQKCEEARIAVRRMRDKNRDEIKKNPDEDERFRKLKELDEETEEINEKIEGLRKRKIEEICS